MDEVSAPPTTTAGSGAEPAAPIELEPTQALIEAPAGGIASEEPDSSGAASAPVASVGASAALGVDPIGARIELLLAEGVERIVLALKEKHALDRFREAQVDRLHAELQQYKADIIGKAVRPVLQSLIRLHDDMGKVLEALAIEAPEQLTPERMLKLLDGFREDVELALARNGVTTFHADAEQFDAKRQRVLRTVETATPAEVGRVAARLRPGFEQGEQMLEKERVAVFVLAPAKSV